MKYTEACNSSHTKPLLHFAWNLLQHYEQLRITLVYPSTFAQILEPEIDLRQISKQTRSRMLLKPVAMDQECTKKHLVDYMAAFQAKFLDILLDLHQNGHFSSIPYPSLCVVDVRCTKVWIYMPDLIHAGSFYCHHGQT